MISQRSNMHSLYVKEGERSMLLMLSRRSTLCGENLEWRNGLEFFKPLFSAQGLEEFRVNK